eukprot:3163994-Rhodomonas_salina.1
MKSADTDRQDDAVRRSSTRFDRTKSSSSRSDLVEARTSSRRAEPGAAARASTRREHFEREVPETVDENRRSSHRFDRAASRPEHEESAVDSRDHRRTSGRFERVPSSRARRARAGGGAEEEEEADSRRSSRPSLLTKRRNDREGFDRTKSSSSKATREEDEKEPRHVKRAGSSRDLTRSRSVDPSLHASSRRDHGEEDVDSNSEILRADHHHHHHHHHHQTQDEGRGRSVDPGGRHKDGGASGRAQQACGVALQVERGTLREKQGSIRGEDGDLRE